MLTDSRLLTSAAWDASSLDQLKAAVQQNPQAKEAQLAVARQVEGMFVQMMLKSMREALPKDGLLSSEQTRLYTSLYDQQIAQQISARGLGLAEVMVKQMSPDSSSTLVTENQNVGEAVKKTAVPMKFDWQTVSNYRNQAINTMVNNAVPKFSTANVMLSGDNQQFLMQLVQPARELSQQTGIPHRLILAQAALESGWGRRQILKANGELSFNLFGIKASKGWTGAVTEATTTEFENGVAKKIKAKFRVYGSYFESLADYIRLIMQNPRYAKVASAKTPEQGAHALQHAGYATDPNYAQKLNNIIQQLKLLSDKAGKVNQAYNSAELTNLF